jgi:DNA-binding NtrC family response regulator
MSDDILVVDADLCRRDLVIVALQMEGYRADGVSGGPDAIGRIVLDPPALVLLALGLSLVTGRECLNSLRASGATMPVVFMAGDAALHAEAAFEGANAILSAPLDLGRLLAVVERYLPLGGR